MANPRAPETLHASLPSSTEPEACLGDHTKRPSLSWNTQILALSSIDLPLLSHQIQQQYLQWDFGPHLRMRMHSLFSNLAVTLAAWNKRQAMQAITYVGGKKANRKSNLICGEERLRIVFEEEESSKKILTNTYARGIWRGRTHVPDIPNSKMALDISYHKALTERIGSHRRYARTC